MGTTSYDIISRTTREFSKGYKTKSADELFEQVKKRQIHKTMHPKNALLRESRDSENHPESVPIIVALDLTGSMRHIPTYMLREGLPKLVSGIIQRGILDPQILFLGIGDHEYDNAPLQVGQFESGDEELDMWLERTWPEGGGGGNAGESYLLAWLYAGNHTVTDAMEKRGKKGFLFTIGDEPCLPFIEEEELDGIGLPAQGRVSKTDALKSAEKLYDVYHLHVMEGSAGHRSFNYWQKLLEQRCIRVDNHEDIPNIIKNIVTANYSMDSDNTGSKAKPEAEINEEIIL